MTLLILSCVILAYALGSIPTSVWIGRAFFGMDVRQHGSGNAGATNTIRVLGWKAGLPVFIFDVFKGWLAVQLAVFFAGSHAEEPFFIYFRIALALAVVLGHVFPVFAGFRGGKGVATLLGVGMALFPVTVWIILGVFIAVLLISGYVSLGSITAAALFPVIDLAVMGQSEWPLIVLSLAVAVFIPLTHQKNIKRLIKGTESRFSFRKRTSGTS